MMAECLVNDTKIANTQELELVNKPLTQSLEHLYPFIQGIRLSVGLST